MNTEDKQALINKVKELEGLSNDEKSQIISFIKTKTYGLVWENSTEKSWEQLKNFIPILVEDKGKAIVNDSDKKSNPNHLVIEGDNLLALTNLLYTYENKIDVIYIDPPYNTGKEFKYNDNYKDEPELIDENHPFRHSKWLSFMERRLKVAERLLSDKGVIFISIDDNELASLRLLMDEIFKSKTLDRGSLIWENRGSTKGFSKIVKNHEYILAYSKDPDSIKSLYNKNFPSDDLIEERLQIKRSPKNPLCQIKFPKGLPIRDIKDITFKGYVGNGTNRIDIISGDMVFKEGVLQNDVVLEASFPYRNQTEKFFNALKSGNPVYDTKGQQWIEVFFSKTGVPHYSKQRGFTILSSILDDVPNSGFSDLEALGLETRFNNPKPTMLINKLLSYFSTENYTILDFFAGSGTTLHATMQLNEEDGGHRQCILVNNNENNICEEVTYERNKRVINGYTKPNGVYVEGLNNNNLRYYRVHFMPREKDYINIKHFALNSISSLCIKEDVYKEMPKFGNLKTEGFRYFKDCDKEFIVILESDMIEPIVEELRKMEVKKKVPIYVFTTGQYPYTEDFWLVNDKVELYPYPSCIYNAYEKVMPKMDDKLIDLPEDIVLTKEESNMTIEDFNKGE